MKKDGKFFSYYRNIDLEKYVNQEIQWLDLSNNIKTGKLIFERGKYLLPESGGVNALTVKIFLPNEARDNRILEEYRH